MLFLFPMIMSNTNSHSPHLCGQCLPDISFGKCRCCCAELENGRRKSCGPSKSTIEQLNWIWSLLLRLLNMRKGKFLNPSQQRQLPELVSGVECLISRHKHSKIQLQFSYAIPAFHRTLNGPLLVKIYTPRRGKNYMDKSEPPTYHSDGGPGKAGNCCCNVRTLSYAREALRAFCNAPGNPAGTCYMRL